MVGHDRGRVQRFPSEPHHRERKRIDQQIRQQCFVFNRLQRLRVNPASVGSDQEFEQPGPASIGGTVRQRRVLRPLRRLGRGNVRGSPRERLPVVFDELDIPFLINGGNSADAPRGAYRMP